MGTLPNGILCRHGHHADLPVLVGEQQDDTAAHLLLELVAEVAQAVHVHTGDSRRQELHAADVGDLVHDITEGGLGLPGLEGFDLASDSAELLLEFFDMVRKGRGRRLDESSRLIHLALHLFIIRTHIVAGQGFDPADAGSDAVLGEDLELTDLAGILYMGSAAELSGEISHLHDADFIAVLLAEQGHGAALFRVFDPHDRCLNIKPLADLLIDEIFDLFELLCCHRLIVAEVETSPARILIGALLLDMSAEYFAQGLLHQVGRAVVAAGVAAFPVIDGERDLIAHLEHAGGHHTDVGHLLAGDGLCLLNFERCIAAGDRADIAYLAALGRIERSLFRDDGSPHAVRHRVSELIGPGLFALFIEVGQMCQCDDPGSIGQAVIAGELSDQGSIHLVINCGGGSAVIGLDPGAFGLLSRLFTGSLKTGLIHGAAVLRGHILGGVDGESIGVIEQESVRAGDLCLSFRAELVQEAVQDLQTLVDRLFKTLLLEADVVQDELPLLFELGITVLGALDHGVGEGRHKRLFDPELSALADRAADQTAEHIAPALVGGHDTVGDHKGSGPDMVGDDTDGNIDLMLFAVFTVGKLTDLVAQGADSVDIEKGLDILYCHSQTLQAHAGINVFLDQIRIMTLAVVVELGKDDVPDLHVAVAFAAHHIIGAVPPLLSAVIVDFSTGTAGTGAVLPEVVLFAEFVDPVRRDMHGVQPDFISFVVPLIDRRVQALGIQTDPLGQKLPCPRNGLFFEIITKGEVAQHLKEGAVAGSLAHVLQVTGTDALLAGRHTPAGRDLLPGEIGLQRSHAGVNDQQALVIVRNQGKAVHAQMPLALEKSQKHLTQLVYTIIFHRNPLIYRKERWRQEAMQKTGDRGQFSVSCLHGCLLSCVPLR